MHVRKDRLADFDPSASIETQKLTHWTVCYLQLSKRRRDRRLLTCWKIDIMMMMSYRMRSFRLRHSFTKSFAVMNVSYQQSSTSSSSSAADWASQNCCFDSFFFQKGTPTPDYFPTHVHVYTNSQRWLNFVVQAGHAILPICSHISR